VGWLVLTLLIITSFNLQAVNEGGDPIFNLIVILGTIILSAIALIFLLLFPLARVFNKTATVELSDTSIKINLHNKNYSANFNEIKKIEYISGGVVVTGGGIRPSTKYMLIIYPVQGKNFKINAPGGIKEYKEFYIFYNDLFSRFEKYNP
jgi:hypothetical protein